MISFKYNLLSAIIIFFLPLIYFLETNLNSFNYEYYLTFFILLIFKLLIIILLSLIFFKIFKDKSFSKLLLGSIFYFLMTLVFSNLYNFFPNIFNNNKGEIVLFICLILFAVIYFSDKISKFFTIFCITTFFLFTGKIIIYEIDNKFFDSEANKMSEMNYKRESNKNIFIIIFDAAISLEEFEEVYELKVKDKFLSNLPNNVVYHKNIKPFSNNSGESIKQIINFNKDHENYKTLNFPNVLKPKKFVNTDLNKFVKKNDLNLYFFGNSKVNCSSHNLDLCFKKETLKTKIYMFYLTDILEEYFKNSLFDKIKEKIYVVFDIKEKLNTKILKEQYNMNNPLSNFNNQKMDLSKNNNVLFFYNYLPHEPYFYDHNCNFKKEQINNRLDYYEGYKDNYLCMIKTIEEFFSNNFENLQNSNFIILADHGYPIASSIKNIFKPIDKNQNILMISKNYEKCDVESSSEKQNTYNLLIRTLKC